MKPVLSPGHVAGGIIRCWEQVRGGRKLGGLCSLSKYISFALLLALIGVLYLKFGVAGMSLRSVSVFVWNVVNASFGVLPFSNF